MRVTVWDSSMSILAVSDDVYPGDETIEIPDALYDQYSMQMLEFIRTMNKIREFQKEQERFRAYSDR